MRGRIPATRVGIPALSIPYRAAELCTRTGTEQKGQPLGGQALALSLLGTGTQDARRSTSPDSRVRSM